MDLHKDDYKSMYEEVMDLLIHRRDRAISGVKNCIPCPFPRFSNQFPGIEKRRYYVVTANTKVGKTQITDYMFLIYPIMLMYLAYKANEDCGFDIRIHYFSLEMHYLDKMTHLMCFWLYNISKGKIRVDVKKLSSVADPVDNSLLKLIQKDEEFFHFVESKLKFVKNVYTVEGLKQYTENYYSTSTTNSSNSDLYDMFIYDHAGLGQLTSMYPTKTRVIEGISKYAMQVRKEKQATFVLIQQQLASAESMESQKYRQAIPTIDNLEYNKTTGMDCDYLLGIYSPARMNLNNYKGYNISILKDRFRILSIMAGRWGGIGTMTGLYFDGAANHFQELPRPEDMNDFYNTLR